MIKYLKFIAVVFTLFISISAFSQPNNDTLVDEKMQIEQNMDSMLNLWYVKNSVKANSDFSYANVDSISYKNIPDSVFEARLKRIPSFIPLTYNKKVRDYIEFYLRHGKNTTRVLIGLSRYYYPIFEQMLDKNQMPDEIKHLTIIESALNPRALSYAGAAGLWQLLYSTGKMYGLEVNSLIDERRDPIKSSYAGIQFLKDLYEIYGDWTLCLAAYNCGPGNVNKAIRRAKGKSNYWDIYELLPKQTRNYVPAFIAATYVMNFYKEHNIQPIQINLPLNTDTIMITKKLHLMQVAEVLKIPIDVLRDMNPQYKKDIIPAEGRSLSLKLPAEMSTKFVDLADSIYSYKDSIYLNTRNPYVAAASYEANYKSDNADSYGGAPPSVEGKTAMYYTVKAGDNFGYIATWFGVRLSDLKYWNDAYSNRIQVGQKVTIYVPSKKVRLYKDMETMSFEEKQDFAARTNSKGKTTGIGTTSVKTDALDKNFIYYTIQQGDNLVSIAKKYPGTSEASIMQINGFSAYDVRRLQVGQVIKVKKKE